LWSNGELREVACDCCGADDAIRVIVRPDGLTVVECRACGLAYVSPRPRPELIDQLYDAGYFEGEHEDVGYRSYMRPNRAERIRSRRAMAERLRILRIHEDIRGRTVLEVGCATGEFAARAARAGGMVTGADVSQAAIDAAREAHGRVAQFSVGDYHAEAGPWDVVCAFEVIEHVNSPSDFLSSMRSKVKPGGLLFISTPDYQRSKEVGPERWIGFILSLEHLTFFSHDVLASLAARTGFRVEAWYGLGGGIAEHPAPRSRARRLLSTSGLVRPLRTAKAFFESPPRYQLHQTGHNVLMVLRG
jgi:2-polyprenyl-3-methyl-5-hydroxy-6-metoxy-1,4-benzoquinol methylase